MYITKKKNHDSPTMLCLILKLEGLSGAHDAHVRFKGKNLCLKTILNILRKVLYLNSDTHLGQVILLKRYYDFIFFNFLKQIGCQRIKKNHNKCNWTCIFQMSFSHRGTTLQ